MRAELAKLRALPLPRWTLAIEVGIVVVAAVIVLFAGGSDSEHYKTAAVVGGAIGTGVGSIVIGVWVMGLEYGQKTIRRALTADPRRGRLAVSKLAVALLAVEATTVAVWALATLLAALLASVNGASSPVGDILPEAASFLVLNAIYATVGWAIALLTRSMAGGITVALALVFVLDTALGAVPSVGDYTLGMSATEIANAISGEGDHPDLARGVLATAAWIGGFTVAGLLRFTRTDVR